MPNPPSESRRFPFHVLLVAAALAFSGGPMLGQQATIADGASLNDLRVRVVDAALPVASVTTLRTSVKLLPIETTNTIGNEFAETGRPRLLQQDGVWQITWPNGDRLFHFENNLQQEFGLLFAPTSGAARVVYTTSTSMLGRVSVCANGNHLAMSRGQELILVRLDDTPFPSTGVTWRVIPFHDNVKRESVTAGATCTFCVLDDGRVFRAPHADGAAPEELTPPGSLQHDQLPHLAISDDGGTAAFLRGPDIQHLMIWIARTNGPAVPVAGPPRAWRQPDPLPGGTGQTWLTFDADGSALMATEAGAEDELYLFDTSVATPPPATHLTANAQFAEYIGAHVLPAFIAGNLLFAAGHQGQMDWYRVEPSTAYPLNLTQTGAPEPPYLVGSLVVEHRLPLADGTALATDRVGNRSSLRRLAPGTGSPAMFMDLSEQPATGGSVDGWPDLRVRGDGGDRLVSGLDGSVLLGLPTGLELGMPVRAASGWLAFVVSLQIGPAVLALRLPDGSLVAGPVFTSAPQLRIDDADRLLVRDGNTLHVFAPGLRHAAQLSSSSVALLLSGAGG